LEGQDVDGLLGIIGIPNELVSRINRELERMDIDLASRRSDDQSAELRHLLRGDDTADVHDLHSHQIVLQLSAVVDSYTHHLILEFHLFLIRACHGLDLLEYLDFKNGVFKMLNSRGKRLLLGVDVAKGALQIILDVTELERLSFMCCDLLHSVQKFIDVHWFFHLEAKFLVLLLDKSINFSR
jgi:hypothetical protein